MSATRDALKVPAMLAALKLLIHLPLITRYGYHRDELYFIQCARELAFGYVDHPPLIAWMALLSAPFEHHLVALRLPSVLAGATGAALAAWLAHELGGRRVAQWMAGLSMIIAPAFLRMGKILCIPVFEPVFWTAGAILLVHIVRDDRKRVWPWLGAVIGLGLLNKHSMLLFALGVAVGALATPLRSHLRTRWPWIGVAISLLLFAPNVVWQAQNDWATVRFLSAMSDTTLAAIPRPLFLLGQVVYMHPFTLPLSVVGLWSLSFGRHREHRLLAYIFAVPLVVLLLTHGKPYYLAPAYPALFAAGAVAIEAWLRERTRRRLATGLSLGGLAAGLALSAPLGLPILPIAKVDAIVLAVAGSIVPPTALTHDLHDEHGWPEQAALARTVFRSLPDDERANTQIVASNYGQASAINFFARDELPRALSGHMSYALWPPEDAREPAVVMTVGIPRRALEGQFASIEEAARTAHPDADEGEQNQPIFLCRQPRQSFATWFQSRQRLHHGSRALKPP